MDKKISGLLIGLLMPFICFAQIEQFAIGGLGGEIVSNTGIRLVQSIGDVAGTSIGSDLELVQGFSQCFKDNLCWTTGIEAYESPNITFRPNPTHNLVYFEGEYTLIHRYEIFTNTGQKLETQPIFENQISLKHLSSGIYYLRVFDVKGELSLEAKLVKH